MDGNEVPLVSVEIIAALPDGRFIPDGPSEPFDRLAGARIVKLGAPNKAGLEGGGLILDYIPAGSDRIERLVLEFNELGMWVTLDTLAAS